MADNHKVMGNSPEQIRWRHAAWQGSKKTALAVLFSAILLIPRLRRLRRRPHVWNAIRLAAVVLGGWLLWRFAHPRVGTGSLAGGVALLAFAAAVRPQRLAKSVDERAREFGALIALNGGTLLRGPALDSVADTRILVTAERLIVVDGRNRDLLEIPVASLRRLVTQPLPAEGAEGGPCKLEITWENAGARTAEFLFEGFFAAHLARVAEDTLRGLLRKDLPVLKG